MPIVKYKSGDNWVAVSTGGSIATDTTYGYLKVATDEDVEEGTDNTAAVTARQIKQIFDNNLVHKTGNETIAGQKTFTSGLDIKSSAIEKAVVPSSNTYIGVEINDKNNAEVGVVYLRDTSTEREMVLKAHAFDGTNHCSIKVGFDSNNNPYATAPTPTDTTSTTSTQIATTGWVNKVGNNIVHLIGNETIAGTKSFDDIIIRNVDLATAGAGGVTYLRTEDSSNKGRATLQTYYTNSQVYNRLAVNNLTANKYGYIDLIIKDTGDYYGNISGNGTNLSVSTVTNSTTSTIIPTMGWVNNPETSTNVVHRSDNETIGGQKTFSETTIISGASKQLIIKNTNITRNTAPSSNVNSICINGRDSADKNTWGIYHTWSTEMAPFTSLLCYKGNSTDNTYARIGVGYDASGNAYTYAPTPAVSDNSTKIATTAWVNSKIQFVNSLPANPVNGVLYLIPES